MKGLIVKDLKLISAIGRFYIIFVSLVMLISFFSAKTGFLSLYAVIFMSILGPSTIAYDERDKWEKFALTLPITKAQYVSSKYLISLILSLAAMIIAVVSSAVNKGFSNAILTNFAVYFVLSLFYPAISLPVILRFGYTKGKIPLVVFAAAFGSMGVFLARLDFVYTYISHLNYFVFIAVFLSAIIFALSWFISVRLYNNKDI